MNTQERLELSRLSCYWKMLKRYQMIQDPTRIQGKIKKNLSPSKFQDPWRVQTDSKVLQSELDVFIGSGTGHDSNSGYESDILVCYSATRRNLAELNFLHEKPFTSTMRSLGRSALQAAQAVLQIKYRCSSETFRNNCFLQCPTTWNILKLLESKIKSSLNGFNDVTWCNFRPVPTSWAAIKAQCQLISGRDLIAADYVAQLPQLPQLP